MKLDSPKLARTSVEARNAALEAAAQALKAAADDIFAANAADLAAAQERGVAESVQARLLFNQHKLDDCIEGIHQLVSLPDPLGRTLLARELDEGLTLRRVTCPIGVIGVIFEARPDALVQIASLAVKSGNCAILKGGSETANTNRALFEVIHKAVTAAGLPQSCLAQAESHSQIDELLACDDSVDLLIPRGSNEFVRHIMDNTKIPVMGHSSGVCHIYAHESCDQKQALRILVDAKTQYPAACNAAETLLVDRSIAAQFVPQAVDALTQAGVVVHGDAEVSAIAAVEPLPQDGYAHEYVGLEMTVALVDGVREAVDHINAYGSHHTDCILATDDEAAAYFMESVDSAGVYRNCSTRFADGFRYGFGAEVGISTAKIHARGPVGLEGLVTYKYLLEGNGQIVGDYASGRSSFHFRDLI